MSEHKSRICWRTTLLYQASQDLKLLKSWEDLWIICFLIFILINFRSYTVTFRNWKLLFVRFFFLQCFFLFFFNHKNRRDQFSVNETATNLFKIFFLQIFCSSENKQKSCIFVTTTTIRDKNEKISENFACKFKFEFFKNRLLHCFLKF